MKHVTENQDITRLADMTLGLAERLRNCRLHDEMDKITDLMNTHRLLKSITDQLSVVITDRMIPILQLAVDMDTEAGLIDDEGSN